MRMEYACLTSRACYMSRHLTHSHVLVISILVDVTVQTSKSENSVSYGYLPLQNVANEFRPLVLQQ
jgi:hypothetical protein